jgi:hypothetical protein
MVRLWAATMWPMTGDWEFCRHQAGSIFPPALLVRGLVGSLGTKDPESGASTDVDSRLQRAEALGEDGHDAALLPKKRLVASRSRCNPLSEKDHEKFFV